MVSAAYRSRPVVIDSGLCNLRSICGGLRDAGAARAAVATEPAGIKGSTHIVIPGVGAFGAASARLQATGWYEFLRAAAE